MGHHVGAKFALLRFSVQKNIRPLPCSSFIAKRHARFNCSLVNALATFHCRYHLFARKAPPAHISKMFSTSTPEQAIQACSDFFAKNQNSLMPLLLLYRKRSHSRRLFGCTRPHSAFGSLPTFCECASGAYI